MAALAYAQQHDGRLPQGETWCDELRAYTKGEDVFTCPEVPDLRCGYAYNAALSGVDAESIPDPMQTVVIYESDAGWNAAGGPELLPAEARHLGGENYGFADGHVAWMDRSRTRPGEEGTESGVRWEVALPTE